MAVGCNIIVWAARRPYDENHCMDAVLRQPPGDRYSAILLFSESAPPVLAEKQPANSVAYVCVSVLICRLPFLSCRLFRCLSDRLNIQRHLFLLLFMMATMRRNRLMMSRYSEADRSMALSTVRAQVLARAQS